MNSPVQAVRAEDRIYLCLSGGGFRAAFFHLGLIRSLRKNGLLKSVTAICAVSGGSITAAHVVSNWADFTGTDDAFDAACRKLEALGKRDIRGRIVRRWLLSLRWLGYGRVKSLAHEYRQFFGKRKIADLYRGKDTGGKPPALYMLATSFTTGHLCSFSGDGFSTLFDDGIKDVPPNLIDLELAIAASSAFPPLFPPLRLTREDVGGNPQNFPVPAIYLTDGGVYDNLGVERCLTLITEANPGNVVLLSDAGGAFTWDETSGFSSLIARTIRSTDIMMRNAALESVRSLAKHEGLRFIHVPIDAVSEAVDVPEIVQSFIKEFRTDLDRFEETEIALLVTHGEAVADKYVSSAAAPIALPAPLARISPDQMLTIAKSARRRSYNLFNFRDYASYILAGIPLIACAAFIYLGILGVQTKVIQAQNQAIAAQNQDLSANNIVLAERLDTAQNDPARVPQNDQPVGSTKKDYTIYIQFAGFQRSAMVDLAQSLQAETWTVPQADKGGQRLTQAQTKNEIRYGPDADRTFAEKLAEDVLASGAVRERPKVFKHPKIPGNSLEIWVSQ